MDEMRVRTIVDEDWKARVQREKDMARKRDADASPQTPSDENAQDAAEPEGDINPAFEALVSTFATQTMFCLGFIAAPGQAAPTLNLDQAKESLEVLLMVSEKTRGNLTASEKAILQETLAELQRLFSARVQQVQAEAMHRAGINPSNLRGDQPS